MLYIGVDLGTSALKLLLVDENGAILRTVTREYPLSFPHPGWSEQDPQDWWRACLDGIPALIAGFDAAAVAGIACGGQMHGLVALDGSDRVIRPAILWNDGRTEAEVAYLNEEIGRETLSARTANIAFAGFTAPKLLWMRRHEPENFARIARVMLPKDYINYCLSGAFATDFSDASGMLLLDVAHRRWSPEMVALCGLTEAQLPRLYESYETIGTLRPEIAAALGLPATVRVAAGAGDNAAAAVGTGTVGRGGCNISLGTSGTVFISDPAFRVDRHNALHSFAHADGGYHLMGCMLSAASCNKWFCEDVLGSGDYAAEQTAVPPELLGRNSVYFLPYLMGERSPINDTNARGVFFGMTMGTTRAEMVAAVLEGVAFALRDSVEVARSLGIGIPKSRICGGGSRSPLWRTILANVLGMPLETVATEQGPGYGAAMLAMVACGRFPDVTSAAAALVRVASVTEPTPVLTARYEDRYGRFSQLYPAMKPLFAAVCREN